MVKWGTAFLQCGHPGGGGGGEQRDTVTKQMSGFKLQTAVNLRHRRARARHLLHNKARRAPVIDGALEIFRGEFMRNRKSFYSALIKAPSITATSNTYTNAAATRHIHKAIPVCGLPADLSRAKSAREDFSEFSSNLHFWEESGVST